LHVSVLSTASFKLSFIATEEMTLLRRWKIEDVGFIVLETAEVK
jgi:hypothetical protein